VTLDEIFMLTVEPNAFTVFELLMMLFFAIALDVIICIVVVVTFLNLSKFKKDLDD
jgi:hypothetical protein